MSIRCWIRRHSLWWVPVLALAPGGFVTVGADAQTAGNTAGQSVRYVPPQRGAPAGRIGGSMRGGADHELTVEVMAPDHVGLSAVDQPVLYWFVSQPVTAPVEITIDNADLVPGRALLDTRLAAGAPAGVSSLALRAAGVRLKPGVTYTWSVAVVADAAERSGDVLASGLIRHEPPPAELAHRIGRADGETAARLYAAGGYWYDAVAALSRGLERKPGRRAERAALMEQVGLNAPAAFERGARP